MNKKSILEEALLEANMLEEAVKNNAKEILASTMKEEIEELVKESLTEIDDEDDSLDMEDMEDLEGGEEEVEDVDMEDIEDVEDVEGMSSVEDILPSSSEEGLADIAGMLPLDLTSASDEEVLTVFKAMGADDGVVVTQDDETISIDDENTGAQYKIDLAEEDMSTWGGNKGDESRSKRDYETNEMYGGNKGDESRSRRDYETSEAYGGNKGDESRSRRDYETNEMYGGNKGDESRSDRDYMGEMHDDEPMYEIELDEDFDTTGVMGVDAPETARGEAGRDYETGDVFEDDSEDLTGEKEMAETSRLKAGPNSSFSRMAGQKGWRDKALQESNRPTSRKRKPRTSMRQLKESYNNMVKTNNVNKTHLKALKEENSRFKRKNQEYKKALGMFKEKINEVAVFNANLAYATKLFTENTTTKKEKINIIRRFDDVVTLKESKSLYLNINKEYKSKGGVVSESVKAKISKSPSRGSSKLLESKTYENPQISRMKEIMHKL